jgi:hypothetical protein
LPYSPPVRHIPFAGVAEALRHTHFQHLEYGQETLVYPFLSLRLFKAWVRVPDFVARRWACSVQVWLHARSVYIRTSVAHAMIRSRGFSRPCCEGVILTIIIRLAILEVAWLCSVGMLRFICVFRAILSLIPAGDTLKRGHVSLLKGRRTLRVFV